MHCTMGATIFHYMQQCSEVNTVHPIAWQSLAQGERVHISGIPQENMFNYKIY